MKQIISNNELNSYEKVIVYGAGYSGAAFLKKLRDYSFNENKISVWDQNYAKIKHLHGFQVIEPDFSSLSGNDAYIIIITLYDTDIFEETKQKFLDTGCRNIIHSNEIYFYTFEDSDTSVDISVLPDVPPIMISIAGFSYGGGEILPIRLANQLRCMGYIVYIHNLNAIAADSAVRDMLRWDIPVLTTNYPYAFHKIMEMRNIQIVNTHHGITTYFVARSLLRNKRLRERVTHIGTNHGFYDTFELSNLHILLQEMRNGIDFWTYVADKNIIPFQKLRMFDESKFIKIPNGVPVPQFSEPLHRQELGLPDDAFVFCTVSRAMEEKGWRISIEAITFAREQTGCNIHLLLIGEGELYDDLINDSTLPGYIHILGFKPDPWRYYTISDACLLASYFRGESAPLTIIEAMQCSIPVIASNVGDIKEMLTYKGEMCGLLVDALNESVSVYDLSQQIINLVTNKDLYNKKRRLSVKKSRAYNLETVAKLYLDVFLRKKEPLYGNFSAISEFKICENLSVTVIVPCYNHEKFLQTRLDSIYNQTYRNFHVILLDDCSTDASLDILRRYKEKYPDITTLLCNEKNSGGVFHQWKKGIEASESDLCWIAESDDYCESDFLQKTVPLFDDADVTLGYCRYARVDDDDNIYIEWYQNYVKRLNPHKWRDNYINDGRNEVIEALGRQNTIPNISGAVFRRQEALPIIRKSSWVKMKICGDWIFYLHLLAGKKLAYTIETCSYFRLSPEYKSSGSSTYKTNYYYREHEEVAITIIKLYNVPVEVIEDHYMRVLDFYKTHMTHNRESDLYKLYDVNKIIEFINMAKKKDNSNA